MAIVVNPNRRENIKDGDRVYKPGDTFPRKITALLEAGLLVEVADEPKEGKKEGKKGGSGQKSGVSDAGEKE